MFIHTRACLFLAVLLPGMVKASAQISPTAEASSRSIHLNVVVAGKSGSPVVAVELQARGAQRATRERASGSGWQSRVR